MSDCCDVSRENAFGGVKVDTHMRTSRAGVYAAGDVTGIDQFVDMAACGAKIAAKNAMNSVSLVYDNVAMPAVVFTDPKVASVGLTEAGARAAGFHIRTSTLTPDHVPRALADSIQTVAIKMGMTYQHLAEMIFPYLTTVEGLQLAAQTFDRDVKELSCCAG